jgi:hypothetical protein
MYFKRDTYFLGLAQTSANPSTPKPCIPKSWEGDHFPDSRLDSITGGGACFNFCFLLPNDPNLGTNDRIVPVFAGALTFAMALGSLHDSVCT